MIDVDVLHRIFTTAPCSRPYRAGRWVTDGVLAVRRFEEEEGSTGHGQEIEEWAAAPADAAEELRELRLPRRPELIDPPSRLDPPAEALGQIAIRCGERHYRLQAKFAPLVDAAKSIAVTRSLLCWGQQPLILFSDDTRVFAVVPPMISGVSGLREAGNVA